MLDTNPIGCSERYATILLGDSNLHHPLWDLYERSSLGATKLLDLAAQWGLDLLTPKGQKTRCDENEALILLNLSQGSLITTANLYYLQIEVQHPAAISWSQPSEHLFVEALLGQYVT